MSNKEQIRKAQTLKRVTYLKLAKDIVKHKRVIYKSLIITFMVSVIITISIPNYYRCTVLLAPELSGMKSSSSLTSLASSFGISLGNANSGDALLPTLYPDLMNSVAFRASLFPIKIIREDDSNHTEMSYYDYLKNEQKLPWWSEGFKMVKDGLSSLFSNDDESDDVNPFKLTKEQFNLVKEMEDKVVCSVHKHTYVITINVIDQDPLVAATLADSVQKRLQSFIRDYRTKKARIDLEYHKNLYQEEKLKYEKAVDRYAEYADANQKVFLQTVRTRISKLENEMNLQYQAYAQVTAQMKMAEAKVQEDTPAFATLQPATVPVKKAGPMRSLLCILFMFVSFVGTSLYAFHKEGHLLPFLGIGSDDLI